MFKVKLNVHAAEQCFMFCMHTAVCKILCKSLSLGYGERGAFPEIHFTLGHLLVNQLDNDNFY